MNNRDLANELVRIAGLLNKLAGSKFKVFPLKDNRNVDFGLEVGPYVDVRSALKGDMFHSRGDSYVLCEPSGGGRWVLGDKEVDLVNVHPDGEIRWSVSSSDTREMDAVKYFGLEPA